MSYPVVNYLDFFIARFILELATGIIIWFVIFGFIYLRGIEFSIKSILGLLALIFSRWIWFGRWYDKCWFDKVNSSLCKCFFSLIYAIFYHVWYFKQPL